ncbi:MAG: NAD(P)-dependent oxidoreductase, partial [Bacteroidales bacterium]|nr:NAD(P)-dependent oxidoreductase [Bacteroidales bacterium]
MKKILISSAVYPNSFDLLKEKFDVIIPEQGDFSPKEMIERIPDCEALLPMFTIKIDKDIIAAGDKLRIISNFGVGFNNIDIPYATERGIVVTNTPDPVIEPTAELAFGLMINVARDIIKRANEIRIPGKTQWGIMENISYTLFGKTLGIIGFGRIGQALARRAVASGMKILYYSRHRVAEEIENRYSAEYVPFDDVLKLSDYVSLNTPLTPETYHLIGSKEIRMMKPTAYLINTARGAVINEEELAQALTEKVITGAALDVYEFEPHIR